MTLDGMSGLQETSPQRKTPWWAIVLVGAILIFVLIIVAAISRPRGGSQTLPSSAGGVPGATGPTARSSEAGAVGTVTNSGNRLSANGSPAPLEPGTPYRRGGAPNYAGNPPEK